MHMRQSQKIFSASQLQSQTVIMKKFVTYFKKTAHFYLQLQGYKKQLATYINCIDYTFPFSALDMDKKGLVSQKNLQNFLIQHKHFHKPIDIDRYYQKYTHGKNQLQYDDIVQCLVPHSDYILMSGTVKNITQNLTRKQNSLYLCNRADNQIIKTIVALIISTEISYLSSSFKMLDNITNNSLRTGSLLWRIIDRHHDNMLDYERMRKIGEENGENVGQVEWKGFINWHFRKHKKYMNRADFMAIFDCLMLNKRNGSDCNIESFVQNKILRTYSSLQRLNTSKVLQKTASRVYDKTRDSFNRTLSQTQSITHLQSAKNLVFEVVNNPKLYQDKSLLYTKLGYKNPNNLIKKSYLIQ